MPELPQMQALSDRLDALVAGHAITRYVPLGFHGLKTAVPPPDSIVGVPITRVGRRAKYLVFSFENDHRMLIHLSQAGRLDIESPPKVTKPKGSVVRLVFEDLEAALLLREHGTERKAGWWVLAPDDDGPLAKLGPEPDSDEFAVFVRTATDKRRLHTMLRDQATVAGIGRGYADDLLHRAHLSPYATLSSLDADGRERLLGAVHGVLDDGLACERKRTGGLSENKLGEHFTVHGKAGLPCPTCGADLHRISYESHEVVYCPACQTNGKVLADRRTSKFLK